MLHKATMLSCHLIALENIEEIFAILELITLSSMEEAVSILGGRDF